MRRVWGDQRGLAESVRGFLGCRRVSRDQGASGVHRGVGEIEGLGRIDEALQSHQPPSTTELPPILQTASGTSFKSIHWSWEPD